MPDLSASWDINNPFGLICADFDYDLAGYSAALGFLSDLAGGTIEADALKINGGSPAQLQAWQQSGKFRRVLAKCRRAGQAERDHEEAVRRAEAASAAIEAEQQGNGSNQRFVPFDEMPAQSGVFKLQPTRGSWGPE